MHIDSYSFGSMEVDGKKYTNDLILFPDRVLSGWWRKEGHRLRPDDLKEVFAYDPDVLVVGTGSSGAMKIPGGTRERLERANICLIDRTTGEAYHSFNQLMEKGEKAAGAFHLTC